MSAKSISDSRRGNLTIEPPPASSDYVDKLDFRASEIGLHRGLILFFSGYAQLAASATVALGALGLLADIGALRHLIAAAPLALTMKVSTALGFIGGGIGLLLIVHQRYRQLMLPAISACGVLVAIIGAVTLAEHFSGRDFGLNFLIPVAANSPVTPLAFLLTGIALVTHTVRAEWLGAFGRAIVVGFEAVVFLQSLMAFTGYLLEARQLYDSSADATPFPLPTAIAFALLSSGLLVIDPDRGLLRRLASPKGGGAMLRRLLPVALMLPIGVSWLCSQWQSIYAPQVPEVGYAAIAVLNVFAAIGLLFWTAARLDESEAARLQGEVHRAAAQYLRSLLEAGLDALVTIDADGRISDLNEATVAATGVPRSSLIGSDFCTYFTEPDKARRAYQDVFEKGRVTDCPLSIRHTSGRITDILYNGSLFHDAEGTVAGVFAAARDITERKAADQRWRASLEATIGAVARTIEMRDPYTAGHQQRVAALAVAIGRELGWPEEQIHGLYLAGIIHDVGKINVPAEILSNPGVLSQIQFQLIKVHPEIGYEIVKGVDFPWPIAEMVRQHHERLDGSGYPRGLKGDRLLPEAKILAVADVVEATMSHRPYRPSRGLDAALAAIEEGKGRLYDAAAVDACLTLLRGGFNFE